ncbi:hypothetical protein E2P81_ATG11773 [Venturia nashicola]|nr:hypothetical protein E2P81_ATG11773 [Venturia nashicola]
MPQPGSFKGSPSPQGTMSVQRRNLPPYALPDESKHMFGEDYFRQQLAKASSSATEIALKDQPSPLEIFGLANYEQWEEQLDWQVSHARKYPQGYTGPGGTNDAVKVERILRRQLATKLINGEVPWRSGPVPPPGPPENENARLEIELPESMRGLRTRPMSSRGVSTARDHSFQPSPVHIPHGRAMAQQHAHRARAGQHRAPSSQQYAPPLNQRQLTPVGLSVPGQHISLMTQSTHGTLADPGYSFSPAGFMMTYPHMDQYSPHVPYIPAINRQTSPAPMGPPAITNPHHMQRRSTPQSQTSLFERVSSGSPVSRSASSVSDMMSSATTSRYAGRSDMSTTSAPRSAMPAHSINMSRSRPMSTPHVPTSYERNNEYMSRTYYGQGVPAQRPTPPPAIGHGRPQISRQQRNQENSEEAAMSALQGEMERVRINEQSREMEGEVMNNTPPNDFMVERYMRE